MKNPLDLALHDPELEEEIGLLTELIVAVAHARVPLDQGAIDAILDPA